MELTDLLGKLEGDIELCQWFSRISGGHGFRGPAGLLGGLVPSQRNPRQGGQEAVPKPACGDEVLRVAPRSNLSGGEGQGSWSEVCGGPVDFETIQF